MNDCDCFSLFNVYSSVIYLSGQVFIVPALFETLYDVKTFLAENRQTLHLEISQAVEKA